MANIYENIHQNFSKRLSESRGAVIFVSLLSIAYLASVPLLRFNWGDSVYLLQLFPVATAAYYLRRGNQMYLLLSFSLYNTVFEYFAGTNFFYFLLDYLIWVLMFVIILKYIGNNKEILGRLAKESAKSDRAERNNARYEKALAMSQNRIRMFLENSTSGYYRSTPDGKLIEANPALQKILGFKTREKLLTIDLASCYGTPADREKFKAQIEKDGKIIQADGMWRREDFSTIYVRESAWGVRDHNGKILYYEGVVEDLTESYHNEKSLRSLTDELAAERSDKQAYLESLEKAQTMVFELADKSPLPIALLNPAGVVQYANNSLIGLLGTNSGNLLGSPLVNYVSDAYKDLFQNSVANDDQIDAAGTQLRICLLSRDRGDVPIDVLVHPFNSESKISRKLFFVPQSEYASPEELEKTITDLRKALQNSKHIGELLPICASCKSIRGEDGSWMSIEQYIDSRSNSQFSHGICPECAKKLYPDFYESE